MKATKTHMTDEAKRLRKEAGAYLSKLRAAKGMTMLDLANKLGLSYYTFVGQIEKGASRVPPDSMRDWARALGVPPDKFILTLLRFYEPYFFDGIKGMLNNDK